MAYLSMLKTLVILLLQKKINWLTFCEALKNRPHAVAGKGGSYEIIPLNHGD